MKDLRQKSSVITQKGKSQNGCFKKKSTPNFPKNKHFLPPDKHTYMCVSRGKKCLFFRKFGGLCFLVIPVLRFALLLYHRRHVAQKFQHLKKSIRIPWEKLICSTYICPSWLILWGFIRNYNCWIIYFFLWNAYLKQINN